MRVQPAPALGDRRGSILVEAALALPVLCLVALGAIEYGRAVSAGTIVADVAREGAQEAIRDGATNAAVASSIRQRLQESLGVDADDVSVTVNIEPARGTSDEAGGVTKAAAGDVCSVNVSVPYRRVGGIAGRFLGSAQVRGASALSRL